MPDNYVKVLTALCMHGNKLELSGSLTVEFELREVKNPLCIEPKPNMLLKNAC
jgi:hypothetical protein